MRRIRKQSAGIRTSQSSSVTPRKHTKMSQLSVSGRLPLHKCYRSLLTLMPKSYTRSGQSERRTPPAPIKTPEWSSRLGGQRRIQVIQAPIETAGQVRTYTMVKLVSQVLLQLMIDRGCPMGTGLQPCHRNECAHACACVRQRPNAHTHIKRDGSTMFTSRNKQKAPARRHLHARPPRT